MQAGLRVHTYPEVLFTAANLTAGGGDCNPDKPPPGAPHQLRLSLQHPGGP